MRRRLKQFRVEAVHWRCIGYGRKPRLRLLVQVFAVPVRHHTHQSAEDAADVSPARRIVEHEEPERQHKHGLEVAQNLVGDGVALADDQGGRLFARHVFAQLKV